MSDQTPNVTSESTGSEAPVIPLKKKPPENFWKTFWWIPVTFFVPFIAVYLYMGSYAHLNLAGSVRSGAIGLGMGALIYALWRLDQHFNKAVESIAAPGSSNGPGKLDAAPVKSKARFEPLLGLLGMMLWLGWVVAAHIMVIANDEAHYLADSDEDGYTISRPSR
jgi:hypothetical protein